MVDIIDPREGKVCSVNVDRMRGPAEGNPQILDKDDIGQLIEVC